MQLRRVRLPLIALKKKIYINVDEALERSAAFEEKESSKLVCLMEGLGTDVRSAFMLEPDINQALTFLDLLDPGGRHTIAAEAPFGGRDREPKWEGGATFEARQRQYLVEDIQKRQARGTNVYYSVNRPVQLGNRKARKASALR